MNENERNDLMTTDEVAKRLRVTRARSVAGASTTWGRAICVWAASSATRLAASRSGSPRVCGAALRRELGKAPTARCPAHR